MITSGGRTHCYLILLLAASSTLVMGCGDGAIHAVDGTSGPSPVAPSYTLGGSVMGGEQPITGATVSLYQAGTSGTPAGSVPSFDINDIGGGFTVPATVTFTGGGCSVEPTYTPTLPENSGLLTAGIYATTTAGTGCTSAPTVTITGSGGYGAVASALYVSTNYQGTATQIGPSVSSYAGGVFNFPSFSSVGYSCPIGALLYITASGGDAGGGTNGQILNLAPIGICTSSSGAGLVSSINMNEATTVAAAYAFSSFISVSGNTVNITAPANNSIYSTTNYSNNVSSSTPTVTASTASGLQHAYENYINLVNTATGIAYSVPPSNSGAYAPGSVINTIANALQFCVNSSGGTSGGTHCAKLFSATPSTSGATATNTLQAAINLAKNPASSASLNASTGIYGLVTSNLAFSPSLSVIPKDWTLAISYPMQANITSKETFPFAAALDANDNVYVSSPNFDPYAPTGTGPGNYTSNFTLTGSQNACLVGFTSNGTQLSTNSTWYCGSTQAAGEYFTQLAPDALGNVWIANVNTSNYLLIRVNIASTGSNPDVATTYTTSSDTYAPRALAVDQKNDIIYAHLSSSSTHQSVWYVTANGASGSSPISTKMPETTTGGDLSQGAMWIALDNSQNIWEAGIADTSITPSSPGYIQYGGTSGMLYYCPVATGVCSTQTAGDYSTSWQQDAIAGGSVTPGGFAQNSAPYGVAIDSAGNSWTTTDAPLNTSTPISAWSITGNVATFTVTSAPTLVSGQQVVLGGFSTSTFFNGLKVTVLSSCAPTSTTFCATVTHANSSATESGYYTDGALLGLTEGYLASTTVVPAMAYSPTITTGGFVAPKWLEVDGGDVVWIADTGGIIAYASGLTSPAFISESGGFNPCIPSTSGTPNGDGTTCTYPDNTSTKSVALDSTGSVWWTTPDVNVPITKYAIASNVVTITAANTLTPGQIVTLANFGTSTFLNGAVLTVLSTGLSSSSFTANFTHATVATTTESGTAYYGTNSNRLIQMIGTGTSTWPLLGTGKPGQMPQ